MQFITRRLPVGHLLHIVTRQILLNHTNNDSSFVIYINWFFTPPNEARPRIKQHWQCSHQLITLPGVSYAFYATIPCKKQSLITDHRITLACY